VRLQGVNDPKKIFLSQMKTIQTYVFIFIFRDDDSAATAIYNAIIIVLDFCFLFVKFWFRCFVEFVEFVRGTPERDVSNDIVLITGKNLKFKNLNFQPFF
jgi:hypothetical protein